MGMERGIRGLVVLVVVLAEVGRLGLGLEVSAAGGILRTRVGAQAGVGVRGWG
jgi:hypothetical protein